MSEKPLAKPFPSEGEFELRCATAELNVLVDWTTKTKDPYQLNVIRAEIQNKQLYALLTSSRNLEGLTERLVALTKRLKWLTIALALLTIILVLDVANKFWQEYSSPPPRLSAPQTPVPPPR